MGGRTGPQPLIVDMEQTAAGKAGLTPKENAGPELLGEVVCLPHLETVKKRVQSQMRVR